MKKRNYILLTAMLVSCSFLFAQSPTTTLPFELYGDHIFIKLKVNNSRDLDFIFDTGDGLTVLNIITAQELGMERGSDAHTTSAEGTISGKLLKHQEIEIKNIVLQNIKIYETSLAHLERSIGRKIDGIIGYDMLKNYVVSMNFDKMAFDIYAPSKFKYDGTGKVYPINLTSAIPHLPAEINLGNGQTMRGEFFINTGAKTTVDFNTHFVDANGLVNKIGDSYIYLVAGLGEKEYEHHRGRIKRFSLMGFGFDQMPVGLSRAPSGIQNHKKVAGIIGSGVLRRFNVIFDYPGQKMYWEPNTKHKDVFPVNASGLELQLDKSQSKVLVHKVFEGGVGQQAGIKLNDVIVSVDGKSASDIGLAELRSIFSQGGKKVSVEVSSGGSSRSVDLTLKPMI